MSSGNDTINYIIKKIVFHQSIKAIKKKKKIKSKFLSNHISIETIKRIINDKDIKIPSSGEILTYFFKKYDFVLDIVTVCVNKALKMGSFPASLKRANIRPIYKKVHLLIKTSEYFTTFIKSLWKSDIRAILYGFKKAHGTQYVLFYKLSASWQNWLNTGGFVSSILMDLSKAYDCLKDNC